MPHQTNSAKTSVTMLVTPKGNGEYKDITTQVDVLMQLSRFAMESVGEEVPGTLLIKGIRATPNLEKLWPVVCEVQITWDNK